MVNKVLNNELIEGCRKSNRKAQLRVYELYHKAMFNTSYRIVNNMAEAEDIMQESFIVAFKKIESYQGTGTFGSWLKRIVINKSLDHLKQRKNHISIDETQLEIEDIQEFDDTYAENVFYQMEAVTDALDKIPDNYRIILSLYLLEGYDQQEIAQILEISYNNVRARYSRAKQCLIEKIRQSKSQYMKITTN